MNRRPQPAHPWARRWTRRRWLGAGAGGAAALAAGPWLPKADAAALGIDVPTQGGGAVFTPEFFGFNIHGALDAGFWPTLRFGAWRIWDTRTNWRDVSPARGRWDFAKLDALVAQGTRAKVRLLLVLGMTPAWASARPQEKGAYGVGCAAPPADTADWVDYVRRVATRYAGQVHEYQIWNEANHPDYWSGSLRELVQLIALARREIALADPRATLVAPSGVGLDHRVDWLRDLLAGGAGPLVDVASYHLYHGAATPETVLQPALRLMQAKRDAGYAAMPLWSTETGYWMAPARAAGLQFSAQERLDQVSHGTAARHLPRLLLLARAVGFERFYWYAWDNIKLGFIERDTQEWRPHAHVLAAFNTLLQGARIHRCSRSDAGLWQCELTLQAGARALACWVERGEAPLALRPAAVAALQRFTEQGMQLSLIHI